MKKSLIACALCTIFASSMYAGLPDPGMEIIKGRTAIVITDPQNDFLSPKGVTWGVVGKNVTENNTVDNIATLFELGKKYNIPVFVSPHYYYHTDDKWEFGGAAEVLMHKINMFKRDGALSNKGFEGSGADWLEKYKPYINGSNVIVTSPHKLYGPESNDLALQLRKRGIDKVVLGGMSANLCTEGHMRELIEEGFEVSVVKDATAAAQIDKDDGYAAALTNFKFIANDVVSTSEIKSQIEKVYK